jgi:hypothetical protein
MEPDPRRVCAVCGRVLDLHSQHGWRHSLQDSAGADHPAVPVEPDEIRPRYRCDFCNADTDTDTGPFYRLPARSFEMPGPIAGHMSHGDWAACQTCATLIRHNQWGVLLRHVTREKRPVAAAAAVRAQLAPLYGRLQRNITGPLVRLGGTTDD